MTDSIAARFYLLTRDNAGVTTSFVEDWLELEFGQFVGDVGYCRVVKREGTGLEENFVVDGAVEVYRSVPGVGLDYYLEGRFLHRFMSRAIDSKGYPTFTSESVSLEDFLARTIIGYRRGTIFADKSGPAEQVMKEYVEENCGPSATIVNGRLSNGVLPGFAVAPISGYGIDWTGSKGFENLLDVLKEISSFASIDFRVLSDGPAAFAFNTKPDQFGEDRTKTGLNTSTGRNAAGNVPVVLSVPMGTLSSVEYTKDHRAETTVVFVLGEGEGAVRTVVVRENTDAKNESPWNRREIARPAENRDEDLGEILHDLQVFGDEVLQELKAQEVFSFTPLQQPNALYGKDYFLGDKITVTFGDIERDRKIVGVKINVSGGSGREVITLDVADVRKTV